MKDSGIAEGISDIYSYLWYPSIADKFLDSNIQFVIMLVLGTIQSLGLISLGIIIFSTKDLWYKTILKKTFFNKYFSWFIFISCEMQLTIFNQAMKCSSSTGFVVKWNPVEEIVKPIMCGDGSIQLLSDRLWFTLGSLFSVATLANVTVFLGLSENIRLSSVKNSMRRNLYPEICMAWTFFFYYLADDFKTNSFIQLIIPLLGYLSMIWTTLQTGSFTSQN
jgi:hypothetical protein